MLLFCLDKHFSLLYQAHLSHSKHNLTHESLRKSQWYQPLWVPVYMLSEGSAHSSTVAFPNTISFAKLSSTFIHQEILMDKISSNWFITPNIKRTHKRWLTWVLIFAMGRFHISKEMKSVNSMVWTIKKFLGGRLISHSQAKIDMH